MAETLKLQTPSAARWAPAVLLAWLIPGGGHFLLKRPGRGAVLGISVALVFLLGLMMRGTLFQPQGGDLLTMVIYYGGFIGDLLSGVHDYGTKFLVAAGLLNLLAMVDAWEIATGKKD